VLCFMCWPSPVCGAASIISPLSACASTDPKIASFVVLRPASGGPEAGCTHAVSTTTTDRRFNLGLYLDECPAAAHRSVSRPTACRTISAGSCSTISTLPCPTARSSHSRQIGLRKSTFLRILAGLVPPSDGVVEYRGHRVTEPVRGIAMVFQSMRSSRG